MNQWFDAFSIMISGLLFTFFFLGFLILSIYMLRFCSRYLDSLSPAKKSSQMASDTAQLKQKVAAAALAVHHHKN